MPEKYEGSSTDALKEQVGSLQKELNELMDEIKKREGSSGSTDSTGVETSALGGRATIQSVSNPEIAQVRLYRWGKETITQQEVMDIVNGLVEPYNSEVSDFIKQNNIGGLQKYLNAKIDSGEIDLAKLKDALSTRGIRLNGNHILEDGKFGPQTLETIRFFVEQEKRLKPKPDDGDKPKPDDGDKPKPDDGDKPKPDDGDKPKPKDPEKQIGGNLDWIIREMTDEISGVEDTDKSKHWSAERLVLDTENFKVDVKNKTISIETRGTSLNSPERAHNPNNRCEYNRATGQIFAYVGKRRYTVPIKLQALRLDSAGLPDGKQRRNNQVVEAFARVGNLLNNLKAHGVYNETGALEEEDGGIEVNNGVMGIKDTQLISKAALDQLRGDYSHIGLKFDTVELAGMLTAMKLDLGKIKWTPDIESGIRMRPDPLDDEHKKYVKRYSQTYGK